LASQGAHGPIVIADGVLAVGYIVTPFSLKELLARVDVALRLR